MDSNDPRAAAFKHAVENADAAELRRLFTEHPELAQVIDAPWFAFGAPALVFLAKSEHREAVDALLDAGADPDAKSDWAAGPYSALDGIVDSREVDDALADHLIARGATLDIHAAAGLRRLDRLREILEGAPERVNDAGPDGAAPLHLARDVDTAAFLLDRGADIEQRCVDHRSTPIMWSTQRDPSVTRYLLERGARPDLYIAAVLNDPGLAERILEEEPDAIDVTVRYGKSHNHLGGGDKYVWSLDFAETPHEVARRRGHAEVLAFLLERSRPGLRMVIAARNGAATRLEALMNADPGLLASLTGSDACAALGGDLSAASLLLERGVDPDAKDDANGATALHHAAWAGDRERVDLLIEHGADPALRDRSYGATPLGWAHEGGHLELVEHLAYLRPPDLVDAAWLGDADRVRDILAADPSLVDGPEGGAASPLRSAAWHGHPRVVRILLEHGADRTLRHPESGKTALDYAQERGHTEVEALLRG